jgi:pimeloyl-ACP methyl ester carboxylesterase
LQRNYARNLRIAERDQGVFEPGDLSGLDFQTWLAQIDDAASDDVFVEYLGPKHATVLWEQSRSLIVTFEHHSELCAHASGVPVGWQLAHEKGWSHLCVISEDQDWFRDPHVIHHFDRLIDDGFLDQFDEVIFYGCSAGGYAAAAYSVSYPLATVIAINPQATLNPGIASWDKRFKHARHQDFTTRFGYAPKMCESAKDVYVFYDQDSPENAMHATLFQGNNVTQLRHIVKSVNPAEFVQATRFVSTITALTSDNPGTEFYQLQRGRREMMPHLRVILWLTQARPGPLLTRLVCQHTLQLHPTAPKFIAALKQVEQTAAE